MVPGKRQSRFCPVLINFFTRTETAGRPRRYAPSPLGCSSGEDLGRGAARVTPTPSRTALPALLRLHADKARVPPLGAGWTSYHSRKRHTPHSAPCPSIPHPPRLAIKTRKKKRARGREGHPHSPAKQNSTQLVYTHIQTAQSWANPKKGLLGRGKEVASHSLPLLHPRNRWLSFSLHADKRFMDQYGRAFLQRNYPQAFETGCF